MLNEDALKGVFIEINSQIEAIQEFINESFDEKEVECESMNGFQYGMQQEVKAYKSIKNMLGNALGIKEAA